MRAFRRFAWLALAVPVPAQAHIVSSRLGDFYGGALHPATSLADVILWLALAILAGLQPTAVARWLVVVFPAALVAGFGAAVAFDLGRDPTALAAAAMIGLGLLAAAAIRLPRAAFLVLAAVLGAARGAANATGLEPGTDPVLFGCGLAAIGYAGITLLTAGASVFAKAGPAWHVIAMRAGGSWTAAIGLMVATYASLRG